MKIIFALTATLIVLALSVAPASAQQKRRVPSTPPPAARALPTVDQIISKYVQALGGAEAYMKLTSRVLKGAVTITGALNQTGTVELHQKVPNKSLMMINFPAVGLVREGYDGTIGWFHDQDGLRLMTGAELFSAKVDADFYKEVRLREVFPTLTLQGTQRLGKHLTYKITGVSAEGHTETMYFDADSGLLVRTDTVEETPEGKSPLEIYVDDYREVDGIKIPFSARHQSAALTMVIKMTEVRHNIAIEDARFAKPAN